MQLFDPGIFFSEVARQAQTPRVMFLIALLIAAIVARHILGKNAGAPTPAQRPSGRTTGRQSQPSVDLPDTETVTAPSVFLMKMRTYEAKHLWVRMSHVENGTDGRRIPTFELLFSSGRFTVTMQFRYTENTLLVVGSDMRIRQLIELAAQSTGKKPGQLAKGSKICVNRPLEKLSQLPQQATA